MAPIGGIAGVTLVIAAVVLGMNSFDKDQMRQSCVEFANQSHYETKYVDYTYWNHDCLAKQKDGTWISAYNLRGVTDSSR